MLFNTTQVKANSASAESSKSLHCAWTLYGLGARKEGTSLNALFRGNACSAFQTFGYLNLVFSKELLLRGGAPRNLWDQEVIPSPCPAVASAGYYSKSQCSWRRISEVAAPPFTAPVTCIWFCNCALAPLSRENCPVCHTTSQWACTAFHPISPYDRISALASVKPFCWNTNWGFLLVGVVSGFFFPPESYLTSLESVWQAGSEGSPVKVSHHFQSNFGSAYYHQAQPEPPPPLDGDVIWKFHWRNTEAQNPVT